ncbi:hypothetical protein GGS21DRAFT_544011 [Xylaria nigripes]|nr:hypothetical protein GGS21DRAFT_544011 [Xylaria nigripes]
MLSPPEMNVHAINQGHSVTDQPSEHGSVLLTVPRSSPAGSLHTKRAAVDFLTPGEKRLKAATDCISQVSIQCVSIVPIQAPIVLQGTTRMSTAQESNDIDKDMPCIEPMIFRCDNEREDSPTLANLDESHPIVIGDSQGNSSDAYPLDDDISDDDIVQLLADSPNYVQENHIPPSSVQTWNHGSQSATEYDPTLEHSPPNPQDTDTIAPRMSTASAAGNTSVSDDLLDEDVDWNAVMTNTTVIQAGSNPDSYPGIDDYRNLTAGTYAHNSDDACLSPDKGGSLPPFVRPPFPEKVRDRPSVPGMSSNTLLRTCFRIGAMISQTARSFNHQQDVIFELYARVTYSNRESLARKQHFQFVDLFKDQHPYPAATLTNWRAGSQLDKDSLKFLDTSGGPRLCRCMCKPTRDPKAAIGWTYTVLSIKEIDWEQIRWVRWYVCGDAGEEVEKNVAAKE